MEAKSEERIGTDSEIETEVETEREIEYHKKKVELHTDFNEIRTLALQARENLKIHRQATGFVYKNHQIVDSLYPLPRRKQVET